MPDQERTTLIVPPSGVPASAAQAPDLAYDERDRMPEVPVSCWRPGFEEFRCAYRRSTEASDSYLWGAYAIAASATLGRRAKLDCGVEVYPNIYVANVGRSGRDRKTTAQTYGERLASRIDPEIVVSHGVGSPEGLIDMLTAADAQPARRVLVTLNELSTLLRKGNQDATRGLAPLLTTLYDCPPEVRLPNRARDTRAVEPLLCLYGSTTYDWLHLDLSLDDVRGGLAGRFWYFTGSPKEPIPFPSSPDKTDLAEAERRLSAMRLVHVTPQTYPLEPSALKLWVGWYELQHKREYSNPILDVLAQRLHVHAWKAALLFSAIEGTGQVTYDQLAAAIEFADYQRDTQTALFVGLGDSKQAKTEQRVIAVLRKHGPLPGWRIQQRVRHVSASELERAMMSLARILAIEERGQGKGRVWALCDGV